MRLRRILWTLAAAIFVLPALASADVITYEREELPGGGVLLVKQSRQLPMVRITVSIPAGARHEAPERAGLANLTSAMITRGTKTRSASDIEKTNDSLGGGVGVEVGRARAEASMRVLTRDLEEGLSLLGDVLRNPVFPAEEIGKTKKRIVGGMRRQRERPGHLANKALRKSLFGETPYGRLVEGTEESIKNLGREDLVRFHRKWYGMKGSIFVFVGDVSLKRARELVLARFKGWQAEGGKIPEATTPKATKKMQVVKIDRPLSQSTVILGNRSLKRTHPDFYAARVMNYILGGGGFSSRIMNNLREEKGLVYSVYSYFAAGRHAGHWRLILQTKNKTVNEAIKESIAEVKRIKEKGVSDQELQDAKDFITGNFATRFGSSSRIANYILAVEILGFSPGYADEYLKKIRAVTKEQILAAARKHIKLDASTLAVVGNLGEAKLAY
ncbi:MAG: pitrilysin family protein [Nitrospinae bacterium]|nr:pitrilysin family protein [Nitrospinota bacterium]